MPTQGPMLSSMGAPLPRPAPCDCSVLDLIGRPQPAVFLLTGLAAGMDLEAGAAAGVAVAGGPPSPGQHTSAVALQVCSSNTMKLRNNSQLTSFLPTL